jgi:hypothetical protein
MSGEVNNITVKPCMVFVYRARKMKERLGLTELRKQANRMNFGEVKFCSKVASLFANLCGFKANRK